MNNTPRVGALLGALLLWAAATVGAQQADVVYLEGFPELKESSGSRFEMDFGDLVRPGDSVITGRTDYVELEQGGTNVIRVASDTVFTLQEVEEDGETQTVLSTTVGSVAFRFNQITGREPRIATPASVAGVRGTELTVYAGSDGSALFLVDSGLVDVEAAGTTVSLTEGEGVEVPAGGPPGEKFEWLGRALDFESWNAEQINNFLEDPVGTIQRIQQRMRFFQSEVERLWPLYEQSAADLEEALAEYRRLEEEQGEEQAQAFLADNVEPLYRPVRVFALNARYYALSALSMRRFVVGNLYARLKSRYLMDSSAPEYQQFLLVYGEILSEFERIVVPRLVAGDI